MALDLAPRDLEGEPVHPPGEELAGGLPRVSFAVEVGDRPVGRVGVAVRRPCDVLGEKRPLEGTVDGGRVGPVVDPGEGCRGGRQLGHVDLSGLLLGGRPLGIPDGTARPLLGDPLEDPQPARLLSWPEVDLDGLRDLGRVDPPPPRDERRGQERLLPGNLGSAARQSQLHPFRGLGLPRFGRLGRPDGLDGLGKLGGGPAPVVGTLGRVGRRGRLRDAFGGGEWDVSLEPPVRGPRRRQSRELVLGLRPSPGHGLQ